MSPPDTSPQLKLPFLRSIRLRFVVVAVITTAVALSVFAIIFTELFINSYKRRIDNEQTDLVNRLTAELQFDASGQLATPQLQSTPKYDRAYSGAYWQIENKTSGRTLRSVSLWDYVIPLPLDEHITGAIHRYTLPGPGNTSLIVQERQVIIAGPDRPHTIRIAVGLDNAEVTEAGRDFTSDMRPYLLALGTLLVLSSAIQLSFGLRQLRQLQRGVADVLGRRASRLQGRFPYELQETVQTINTLLASQEASLETARRRAADLAHGLKTPLTVLGQDAERIRRLGHDELAGEIESLTDSMQAHIDGELTRSRLVSSPHQRRSDANVNSIVDGIVRTLARAPRETPLQWHKQIDTSQAVSVDPHDLRELLGNLLENAWKWASTQVRVTAIRGADGRLSLSVEDDGPGVSGSSPEEIFERGKRLDSRVPGTGLGLSIVREIAQVYGIGTEVGRSDAGGLRITLNFPSQSRY